MNTIKSQLLPREVCPDCLAVYAEDAAALYVIYCRDDCHVFPAVYWLREGRPVVRPADSALCGRRLPGAWHARIVAVSRLLVDEGFVQGLLERWPALVGKHLTTNIFSQLGIDLGAELALGALGR